MMKHVSLAVVVSALSVLGCTSKEPPRSALPELPAVTVDGPRARAIAGRLHDLEMKTEHRRYNAANDLSAMGPAAAPGLAQLVTHSDPAVRGHAVAALGWMAMIEGRKGNESFAALLIPYVATGLGDSDPSVRRWAAEVLGKNGSRAKGLIHRLQELQLDADADVRQAATDAVKRIRSSLDVDGK